MSSTQPARKFTSGTALGRGLSRVLGCVALKLLYKCWKNFIRFVMNNVPNSIVMRFLIFRLNSKRHSGSK